MAALVLGGVHSGVGKTTLTNAITEALRCQGLRVSVYTVGPGLSSPFVSGSSSPGHLPKNAVGLDGWLLSEDATRACLLGLSADADISLIEGCLGMFDSPSADGSEQGSTAQIAQSLQVPVVLVVDASTFNTVRGVVALVKGYTAVDGSSSIAGVILNKVTSTTLAAEVQEGLKQADVNVAVLGAVPLVEASSSSASRSSCPWSPRSTSSNGLMQPQQPCINEQLMVQLVQQHIDMKQLQAISATAATPRPQSPLPPAARTFRVSMGVAYDEAFHQYFQQNLHMLTAAGVQLVPFSPLHDQQLPPGLSAVLLGGGPLTDWVEALSANIPMLEAVRAFASAGGLVIGEGAGLMYLSQSVQQPGQQRYGLVGLFPFHTQRLSEAHQGKCPSYVEVTVQKQAPHPLLLPGCQLRGVLTCHCQVVEERLVGGLAAALAAAADQQQADGAGDDSSKDGSPGPRADSSSMPSVGYGYSCVPLAQQSMPAIQEGYSCGTALASCVQVHYGSCPEIAQHMAQRCLRVDVASVTAAASAAAARAAYTAAAAAAVSVSVSCAHEPTAPVGDSQHKRPGINAVAITNNRAASAPDLQQVWPEQHTSSITEGSASGNMAMQPATSTLNSCGAGQAYPPSSMSTRKSASIPSNMYQLGLEQYQQHQQLPGQGHHSRHASFGSSTQQQQDESAQQQGWHPQLPLHVPKRWSLELQRLGSFTSQLLPGVKSPTGQQQHSRAQPTQHPHASSSAMGHLPEEAPLSDDALKLLDTSLPIKLGRTHHTHIGLAVPLSASNNSSKVGSACVSGAFCSDTEQQELGSVPKCPSIHEQMSQLAASMTQQGASAAGSLCSDPAPATDGEVATSCFASAAAPMAQLEGCSKASGCAGAAEGLPFSSHQQLASSQLQHRAVPRLSLDQHNVYSAQVQQKLKAQCAKDDLPAAAGLARYSLDTAYPSGFVNIQQQLQRQQADGGQALPEELSFRGMLAHNLQQRHSACGSSGNLQAAGTMSKSNSSSKLNPAAAAASGATGTGAAGSGGSIISLSPAATDCLIALGLTSRLAGVTDACRVSQAATAAVGGCQLSQLLISIRAPWAAEAAEAEAARAIDSSSDLSSIPVVCRLVDGPDGQPRYKLDEDYIRRVQPSLVLVACEENSDDELPLQHYQQLKGSPAGKAGLHSPKSPLGPSHGGAAHGSSSLNGVIAVPGRVRLQVSVVQRVLQRAGVLWPEQRAVVLYQRCHSLCEVLEFILVLGQAAGVPDRGVQLVEGLRARLRAAAGRLCSSSDALSRRASGTSTYSINSSRTSSKSSRTSTQAASSGYPTIVVLESVSPLRLAGSWVPEMLHLVGAREVAIAPAVGEPSAAVSWVQLRAAAPDILVLAVPGLSASEAAVHTADLAALPGFWALPAVRSGAVYVCDNTLLARPGPGCVLGVEVLGHLVAPDQQQLPSGLAMGSVLKLSLYSGQRCRPRLVPNYLSRFC